MEEDKKTADYLRERMSSAILPLEKKVAIYHALQLKRIGDLLQEVAIAFTESTATGGGGKNYINVALIN